MKKLLIFAMLLISASVFAQGTQGIKRIPIQVDHWTTPIGRVESVGAIIECRDSAKFYELEVASTVLGSLSTLANHGVGGGGGGSSTGDTLWVEGTGTNSVKKSGASNISSGKNSTAMGNATIASSSYSTAMGVYTIASGQQSTAMGNATIASGNNSMAMGFSTIASSIFSTAMGRITIANDTAQTSIGQFNDTTRINTVFDIGIGTSAIARKDAFEVLNTGDIYLPQLTASTVLGLDANKKATSLTTVDLSTLGVQTTNEWDLMAGTYFSTSQFVITGATYNTPNKYNRALVKVLSKRVTATINSTASDWLAIATHGQDTGLIVRFIAGTLPTVSGGPALALNRPYFIVSKATDSLKISERPSGTAINFTTTGSGLKVMFQKQAYISNITTSADGTIDTITVVSSANLAATDSLFYISKTRKIFDYQEYSYTGGVEVIADASNPQGRRILDTKQPMFMFAANSALGKAGTTCTWNIYRTHPTWTAPMYSSAPAMATALTLNAQRVDQAKQYVAQGGSISFRVTAVAGAPAFLQWQIYLVPVLLYAQD